MRTMLLPPSPRFLTHIYYPHCDSLRSLQENQNMDIRCHTGDLRDIASCEIDFGITINSIKDVPVAEFGDVQALYVRITIMHGITEISETLESGSYPVSNGRLSHDEADAASLKEQHKQEQEDLVRGTSDFEGTSGSLAIKVGDLPMASKLVITLHDERNDSCLAHIIQPLFAEDKIIPSLTKGNIMFMHDAPNENWRAAKSVGHSNCAVISIEYGRMDLVGGRKHSHLLYKHIDAEDAISSAARHKKRTSLAAKAAKRNTVNRRRRSSAFKLTVAAGGLPNSSPTSARRVLSDDVKRIVNRDLIQELTEEEKQEVWRSRRLLLKFPSALPALLNSVDYGNREQVHEAEALMEEWEETANPLDALQLLDVRYASPKVREYAVRTLNIMTDEELSEVMLQLVQVLKVRGCESRSDDLPTVF